MRRSAWMLAAAAAWAAAEEPRNLGLDALLGGKGRATLAARLAAARPGGQERTWAEYSAWGKELFLRSRVAAPPEGPKPSKALSVHYTCTQCHNNCREDRVLTRQDPEDRVRFIAEAKPGEAPFRLQPGTSLWGAANREAFYTDSYAVYHGLLVEGGRPMNPKSLEDATQVCCTYCSVGRLAEPWEIDALLAYQWDLEVTLGDLGFPADVEKSLAGTLTAPSGKPAADVAKTRTLLRGMILLQAGDKYTAPPKNLTRERQGEYLDKAAFKGDAARGQQVYRLACDHCHGAGKPSESEGAELLMDLKKYHGFLAHGTHRTTQPYMPMFTAERLSRQQIADVQTYLTTLKK